LASTHRLGVIEFAGAEDTSSTIVAGARIEAFAVDAFTATGTYDHNTKLEFAVQSGTSGTDQLAVPSMILDANSRISLSNNDAAGATGNTVFGKTAGNALASGGTNNVFIGESSGESATTAKDNVFLGTTAGNGTTDVDKAVLIGSKAGKDGNMTSDGTIGIGYQSLNALTSGAQNTAVGYTALATNVDGSYNTAIGYESLYTFEADSANHGDNTAVGCRAGKFVFTGTNNTFLGKSAGEGITGTPLLGNSNTAVGNQAGLKLQGAAHENTFLGSYAGDVLETGSDNTCIGYGADTDDATAINQTVIGHSTTGVADNSVVLGNANVTDVYMASDSGAVVRAGGLKIGNTVANPVSGFSDQTGIGCDSVGNLQASSDGAALEVGRTSTGGDGALVIFRTAGTSQGNISVSGSTVAYNTFLGSHWSELTDGSFPNIEIGTVVSTIDEILEGHDDRLPKFKVSDSEGDKRVYGVFGWWNYDDIKQEDGSSIKADTPTNASIHSLGSGRIRVTGSCEGGDLLESNGDGTAKVQSDDTIRSKTIGKVSVGNTASEVKLVPCVLYCG
jgi:hypothetical protein